MESLRILLVDDHVLFRKGLRALLAAHEGVEIVGEAGDGLAAIALARETAPDVILMDIHMSGCNGLEAVRILKQEMPVVQIIMLTVSDDDRDLFTAIKNGANGYLLKNLEPDQLVDMLDGARRGEAAISRTMAARILEGFRQPDQEPAPEPEEQPMRLTPRELEVLERVVEGDTNREIAETLVLSEHTVKLHLQNILDKLHLKNRLQAAVYAVREGLLGEEPPAQ